MLTMWLIDVVPKEMSEKQGEETRRRKREDCEGEEKKRVFGLGGGGEE